MKRSIPAITALAMLLLAAVGDPAKTAKPAAKTLSRAVQGAGSSLSRQEKQAKPKKFSPAAFVKLGRSNRERAIHRALDKIERWHMRHPDVPVFYGMNIYAKRVVFIVDRSKSMLSTVDEETRLEQAQTELVNAIKNLPDGTFFNIIAFDQTVIPWKPRLVSANLQTKREAFRAVWRLIAGRKTAAYDALERGLALDPNIELIVFLSDGRPTAGQIVVPDLIVDVITKQNLLLRATINTIGIDARDVNEEFLKDLAESNFGEYLSVR